MTWRALLPLMFSLAAPAAAAPIQTTGASGADTSQELAAEVAALQARMAGMGDLRLGEDARWADHTLINDGVCRAVLDKGIMVPVLSGGKGSEERTVGFVFIGEGSLNMRFPQSYDALAFANHMVQRRDADPAMMAPVAHQEFDFKTDITRAVVLTADRDMHRLMRMLDPVGGGTIALTEASEQGVNEEYVVTTKKGETRAKLMARSIMADRRTALQNSGMDPVEILRLDRLLHDELQTPGRQLRLIAEYQTTERYGVASGDGEHIGNKAYDRWLSCFRDGSDLLDSGLRSFAFAHGTDPDGARHYKRFSGERFPVWEEGAVALPPARVEPVQAEVEISVEPRKRQLWMHATVESDLVLRATAPGVQHLVVSLPRHQAMKGSFQLDKVATADGTPLAWMELDAELPRGFEGRSGQLRVGAEYDSDYVDQRVGSEADTERSGGTIAIPRDKRQQMLIVLPEPLDEGEKFSLQLDWQADWSYANWGEYGDTSTADAENSGGNSNLRGLGATTGPRAFLPELLPESGGTAWDFEARVSYPPRKVDLAMSGLTLQEGLDEGGWPWAVVAGKSMRHPAIALGRWKSQHDPAAEGLPAVRTHLFPNRAAYLTQFGPEVRRVMVFMRQFVPMPAYSQIDVMQGASTFPGEALTQRREIAPAGVVGMSTVKVAAVGGASELQDENPYLAQSMIARELASQVWSNVVAPASHRDAWMAEALAESYGAFYVRAAMKEDGLTAFDTRMDIVHDRLQKPRSGDRLIDGGDDRDFYLSLTDGGSWGVDTPILFQDYGFYVIGWMLRERIGDYAFFRGLDRFARLQIGNRVTTEQLQAALEKSSGQDLTDFFDYWVYGGFVPTLDVTWRKQATGDTFQITGCVTTDVPFGRFDLPMVIMDRDGERGVGALVDVQDGRGAFIVEGRGEDLKVVTDPYGLVIAYNRKTREVTDETPCEALDRGADTSMRARKNRKKAE